MAPSHTEGKSVDRSTQWSENTWDSESGRWYSMRLDPSGEPEYYYHQPSTFTDGDSVPRDLTFGGEDNSGNSGTESFQNPPQISQPSTLSDGPTYAHATDSYTTATSNASWYNSSSTYSSEYGTSISSTGNQASSAVHYGPGSASSSSSQYGSVSADARMAQLGSNSTSSSPYSPIQTPKDSVQDMTSAFSNMGLTPINEGEYSQSANQQQGWKNIKRAPGSPPYETLDTRYRVVEEKEQRNFWKVGRVFMMLWTEPANDTRVPAGGGTRNGSHYSTTWLGGTAYSEVRRFVVIAEGYGNSICSPIQTYSGQATLKPNLPDRQQHAIIYTSRHPPAERSYTAYDDTVVSEQLSKDPIKVRSEQDGPEGQLDPLSRINYSKIYTVENYVRVLNIGMVERDSLPTLKRNSFVQRNSPVEKPRQHPARSSSTHHHKKVKGKGGR